MLNLKTLWVKIQNCALLLDFLALFHYTARMSLISRTNPVTVKFYLSLNKFTSDGTNLLGNLADKLEELLSNAEKKG